MCGDSKIIDSNKKKTIFKVATEREKKKRERDGLFVSKSIFHFLGKISPKANEPAVRAYIQLWISIAMENNQNVKLYPL